MDNAPQDNLCVLLRGQDPILDLAVELHCHTLFCFVLRDSQIAEKHFLLPQDRLLLILVRRMVWVEPVNIHVVEISQTHSHSRGIKEGNTALSKWFPS